MEEPTPIPTLPESSDPRHCPDCGARVADLASTCLICGAALDVEDGVLEELAREARVQIPWRGLIAGILTALAFIALVVWLVRLQAEGHSGTPTPTLTVTTTARPTRPPKPSDTPAPTPTFTPVPPRVHQVQSGETCVLVATTFGMTLDNLVALNPEKCGPGGIIRPGDLLLVPAFTPTPGPTPTGEIGLPLLTPECPILHIVQAGDTGISIAEKYGVSFSVVETSNPQVNFEQLPVNHVLQIPCSDPAPTPTPTADPYASPTPISKYSAPVLLSPADGATLSGPLVPLQWGAVSLLRDDELYAVRLRRADESLPVESIYTRTTLVRLDEAYAPTDDDPVREFSWQVTVVRFAGLGATGEPRYSAASQTSDRRSFRWSNTSDTANP